MEEVQQIIAAWDSAVWQGIAAVAAALVVILGLVAQAAARRSV